MHIVVRDPMYTERLVSFLASLGRYPVAAASDRVEIDAETDDASRLELEIYLGIWRVLYPDAELELSAA